MWIEKAQIRLHICAILLTFIKLPFVIEIFVLSIFEWSFYTGFTVYVPLELEMKAGLGLVCLSRGTYDYVHNEAVTYKVYFFMI